VPQSPKFLAADYGLRLQDPLRGLGDLSGAVRSGVLNEHKEPLG